jgi:hypothetical protein
MALALIPYTLVVQGIYTGLIGTIGTITMGTCRLVKSMYTTKNPDITKIIIESDIERRLRLIQSVLNVIDHDSKRRANKMNLDDLEKTQIFDLLDANTDFDNDPIELCLIYLHETIQHIHNDLSNINKKVTNHNSKWFSNWRTLNVKSLLESFKLNSKRLDLRFDDLTKISMFLANKKHIDCNK